jgi:hypothetical protein
VATRADPSHGDGDIGRSLVAEKATGIMEGVILPSDVPCTNRGRESSTAASEARLARPSNGSLSGIDIGDLVIE